MADTYWDGQVEALERRLRAVAELPFQARGQSHRRAHDGISGRDVLLNPAPLL
jgi:hypothetical protein